MRLLGILLLTACVLEKGTSTPVRSPSVLQIPLEDLTEAPPSSPRLHGRFLHITDLHPDPFYKIHSSTTEEDACHRGVGVAGVYGAETTDCDTPFGMINATFKWIEDNLRDTVDFVVWTGDSARHDSDEEIPRTRKEVLDTNRWIADKFIEVFGDPKNHGELTIPIISTFGNNDILPHNILLSGPNHWLTTYSNIWGKFIPEEQRHGFERGGWYYVEVIPQKLAVFSLNTLYFFSQNAGVDGCAIRSEPGYEHFEWLRIQLQFMRERGMKVILTGHVPPARTESKQLWDETCWQKYTLWLRQYRDVVVGGLYGHMNIDHFMLQDQKEIDLMVAGGGSSDQMTFRTLMDDELTIESASDYLEELRDNWAELPNPPVSLTEGDSEELNVDSQATKKKKKSRESKRQKALKKIGGPWGERFQVTLVSPSLVPNYFPTLRVVEYNISGLDGSPTWASVQSGRFSDNIDGLPEAGFTKEPASIDTESASKKKKHKKKPKKPKKPKNPDLIIPSPPSKSSPPGPGYSPQPLTLTGYTQYFANLTYINNDNLVFSDDKNNDVDADKWREGKHKGKHAKTKPTPKPFQFEVEYDTFTDRVYNLKDLTVRSYLRLAHRIGQYKPEKGDEVQPHHLVKDNDAPEIDFKDNAESEGGKKKKRKKKKKKHAEKNKVWLRFIRRAFVNTLADEELQSFDTSDTDAFKENERLHDEEL